VAVREIRRIAEAGRQISMVSTHPGGEGRCLAALLFARWSQENYFRYMRQHYGLDALVERGTEQMPDTEFTVNPVWRKLQAQARQKQAELRRRFTRLRSERKYFLDTIKMISYRAEISMASVVREKMSRPEDAHSLLRQIFDTEVDLIPDLQNKTLTVKLHHLTQRAHDEAIRHLCEQLNATESLFPGTELKLIYQLGSS
jgi:hypothetical protein